MLKLVKLFITKSLSLVEKKRYRENFSFFVLIFTSVSQFCNIRLTIFIKTIILIKTTCQILNK